MPDIVLAAINAKWIHPSLALRLLKANMGELEDRCEILEFALRQPLVEKVEPVLAARPRILGLSVYIWNHTATIELLKILNDKWAPHEKPVIVLGGPEVSWLSEEAEIFSYADYVIRGEGEESFRGLCREIITGNKPAGDAAGKTVFINQGETRVDLNSIASAYRLYTDDDLRRKLVYVEASRGCPFGCEYCQGSHNSRQVREFPLEPFLADMDKLIDRGGRTFKFLDRSFNFNAGRAKMIMEFFLSRIKAQERAAEKVRPLCVHFEMVPSLSAPALREIIRGFPQGSLRLELGIQTLNPQTAALIQRASNPEKELENLKFLRKETNAILHVDLIAGLPGEDLASFGAGFDRLWRVLSEQPPVPSGAHSEIQVGILKCLNGTPIARHNGTHRMRYSARPPYEVIESQALPAAELDRIKNFARFWEIIVNRDSFPDLVSSLLPPAKPVFGRFMNLSDKLLKHFGKNWGLDKKELEKFLTQQTVN